MYQHAFDRTAEMALYSVRRAAGDTETNTSFAAAVATAAVVFGIIVARWPLNGSVTVIVVLVLLLFGRLGAGRDISKRGFADYRRGG